MKQLNWGIIGTGSIAHKFASELPKSHSGRLVAVASRTQDKATQFAGKYGEDVRAHGSYEALLADDSVDAIYISTPHPSHAEWAIRTLEAGKGALCEKPLTINAPQAMTVIEAGRANGAFLMEAFMYRCHPQTQRLRELLRDGAIGPVRLIQASFSFDAGYNLGGRLLNNALGGGGILDVGCYTASMVRLVAGEATGKRFAEPYKVQGLGHVGAESKADEWASAQLLFKTDEEPILAQLQTGVRLSTQAVVHIYGANGWIEVPSPWMCSPGDGINIRIHSGSKTLEERTPSEQPLYALEADVVAEHFAAGAAPQMTPQDSLGNLQLLDAWRKGVGVSYEADTPQAPPAAQRPVQMRVPASLEPPSVAPDTQGRPLMRYGSIAHLDKPISLLAVGAIFDASTNPLATGYAVMDAAFERGVNTYDTAYVYQISDGILGNWIRSRGIRDEIVVLGKGAHTPHCNPESMERQLKESLGKMGLDFVDIYMPHRDNPDIPVGEWIDAFNQQVRAGRCTAFGCSNWALERVQAANEYAQQHGLQGLSATSINFSLARMVDPVWGGCISVSDADSRAWFTQHQLANFAWSSQARGFFLRGDENYKDDEEMVRCWYAPDNFQRLRRAQTLAAEKGTTPINIAAAYVLAQPFPQFALIGPRAVDEVRTSLTAMNVQLTPEECAFLNLERDAL